MAIFNEHSHTYRRCIVHPGPLLLHASLSPAGGRAHPEHWDGLPAVYALTVDAQSFVHSGRSELRLKNVKF